MTIRGAAAARFLVKVAAADAAMAQILMAKATGNFKRGSEKIAKRRNESKS